MLLCQRLSNVVFQTFCYIAVGLVTAAQLTEMGDPSGLNARIDWEAFRPDLNRVHEKDRKSTQSRRFRRRHTRGWALGAHHRPTASKGEDWPDVVVYNMMRWYN